MVAVSKQEVRGNMAGNRRGPVKAPEPKVGKRNDSPPEGGGKVVPLRAKVKEKLKEPEKKPYLGIDQSSNEALSREVPPFGESHKPTRTTVACLNWGSEVVRVEVRAEAPKARLEKALSGARNLLAGRSASAPGNGERRCSYVVTYGSVSVSGAVGTAKGSSKGSTLLRLAQDMSHTLESNAHLDADVGVPEKKKPAKPKVPAPSEKQNPAVQAELDAYKARAEAMQPAFVRL